MKRSLIIIFVICINSFYVFAQDSKVDFKNAENKKSNSIEVNDSKNKSTKKQNKEIKPQEFSANKFEKTPEKDFKKFLNKLNRQNNEEEINDSNKDSEETEKEPKKEEKKPKYEVSLSANIDSLSNNFGMWRTASLFAKRKSEDGKILWGEYRASERRDIRDRELVFGIYQPLKKRFAFTVESSVSNSNRFVAKYSIRAEGEKVFKGGWVGHVGYWYKFYDPIKVNVLYGEVEKYWGSNRISYKLNFNNISNAGTSPSNTITYNRYYGERINTVGVTFGFGEEEEFVEPIIGVLKTNTLSVTGSFKHWITKSIGIDTSATFHKQGEFYYRRGLNLGVRYRF